jgi:hypothetical protein
MSIKEALINAAGSSRVNDDPKVLLIRGDRSFGLHIKTPFYL